jgi:hypothetical protein
MFVTLPVHDFRSFRVRLLSLQYLKQIELQWDSHSGNDETGVDQHFCQCSLADTVDQEGRSDCSD